MFGWCPSFPPSHFVPVPVPLPVGGEEPAERLSPLTTTVSLIRTGPLSSAFYSLLNDATFAAAAEGSRDGRGHLTVWAERAG